MTKPTGVVALSVVVALVVIGLFAWFDQPKDDAKIVSHKISYTASGWRAKGEVENASNKSLYISVKATLDKSDGSSFGAGGTIVGPIKPGDKMSFDFRIDDFADGGLNTTSTVWIDDTETIE